MQTAAAGAVRGFSLLTAARAGAACLPPRGLSAHARHPCLEIQARQSITSITGLRERNRAAAREMDLHHALNDAARKLVPLLNAESHKGSHGKVCVVGGCREYTGAPYFAAISALKVGADLAYVLCTESAAPVIKTYSPELIVLPYLPETGNVDHAMAHITPWVEKATVIVVGPGLGDEPPVVEAALKVMEAARARNVPLLVDGSGLNIVAAHPGVVRGYDKCILTPNISELGRLAKAVDVTLDGPMGTNWQKHTQEIAAAYGGVTIVSKGPSDFISNGTQMVRCQVQSSLRRAGGQGDVLSGSTAAFMAWAARSAPQGSAPPSLLPSGLALNPMLACAYGGCLVMRTASYAAFQETERSMLAGDVIRHLHKAFRQLFSDHP